MGHPKWKMQHENPTAGIRNGQFPRDMLCRVQCTPPVSKRHPLAFAPPLPLSRTLPRPLPLTLLPSPLSNPSPSPLPLLLVQYTRDRRQDRVQIGRASDRVLTAVGGRSGPSIRGRTCSCAEMKKKNQSIIEMKPPGGKRAWWSPIWIKVPNVECRAGRMGGTAGYWR